MAHDDDLIALVDQLARLEFERGRTRAQLEFHLRLRHVAQRDVPPKRPAPPVTRAARAPRGFLQKRIVEELAKCDNLTNIELAQHLGANSESVRQSLTRLISLGRVRRADRLKYALVEDGDADTDAGATRGT